MEAQEVEAGAVEAAGGSSWAQEAHAGYWASVGQGTRPR